MMGDLKKTGELCQSGELREQPEKKQGSLTVKT